MEINITKRIADSLETQKPQQEIALSAYDVTAWYGDFAALHNISMSIKENQITSLIGPSGCGKSTFLRLFNRMNDFISDFRVSGTVKLNGKNIYSKTLDVVQLRKDVGMVFQKPNPFPKSIFENVAYGLRIQGINSKSILEEKVEQALKQADLWNDVKDILKRSALALSGGQQQRVCIARCLAVEPKVILMDEPTSALDPISTARIEVLLNELKERYTIVIVTHNMQQAARISQQTAFFYIGDLIEFSDTEKLFTNPEEERTQNYVTGRFG